MQVETQNITVPKLRFTEFDENWAFKKFRHLVKINQGLQIPISERYLSKVDNSHFYITNEFLKSNSEKKYYIKNPNDSVLCDVNDVLMTRTGNTGMVVTNVKGAFHNNFFKIAYPNTINKNFLVYFLNHTNTQNTIKRLAGTSTIPDLNHSDFYRIDFPIIGLPEQEKIASFLSAVDERIQKLERKKSLLAAYKKGVMRQLFSQEIRFRDENGNNYPDWEEKKLGQIFNRITTKNKENNKNVLTISAQKGLINQEKYFNKSVSSKDLTGYYLLNKGDFAYNKSYSKGYPMGAIKRLANYDKGVVSTLYICFNVVSNESQFFFEQYFESGLLNKELHKIAQEGARNHGLLNISVVEFFEDINLITPQIEEQQKIASFLSEIDKKIELVETQIQQSKNFKKGLLQQMFV